MLIAFVAGVAFVVLTICVFNDAPFVMQLDAAIDRLSVPLRTHGWSRFFSLITFFGGVFGVALVSLAVAIFTHWNLGVIEFGFLAVGGSALVAQLVKLFTARMRPDHLPWRAQEPEYSYPSGHSTSAITLYGLIASLCVLLPHGFVLVALCVVLILAIGYSRIALSVHHASDVLGGYLLGATFLCIAFSLFG